MPDKIKLAFSRVKNDIFCLGEELNNLKIELIEIKKELNTIKEFIEKEKISLLNLPIKSQTHQIEIPTYNQDRQTIPTDKHPYNAYSSLIKPFSIGNRGVPTDRQTDRQTDRHIADTPETTQKTILDNQIDKTSEILENLDKLKKELRLKIKQLTEQEMNIFSLLYSLEEQGELVDYKSLANKTNLSESSIRDYILKISNKNLPILKEKLNNKRILLHISPEFKKLASLETLLKLREV